MRCQLGFHELNRRNQLVLDPFEPLEQRMRSVLFAKPVTRQSANAASATTGTYQEPGRADKVDGDSERFRPSRRTQMREAVNGITAADPGLTRLELVHMVRNI